jgi:hypothetical protein
MSRILGFELEQMGKTPVANHVLLPEPSFNSMKDRVARLINNSDSRHLFFLPRYKNLFPVDSAAVLSLGFTFRRENCPLVLRHRVLSLLPEFRAKIGMILAQYYGRVATDDIQDDYGDEGLLILADRVLKDCRIVNGHNNLAIDFVRKGAPAGLPEIEKLVKDFQVQEKLQGVAQRKKEVVKYYNKKIHDFISDSARLEELRKDQKALRYEITKLAEGLDVHLV